MGIVLASSSPRRMELLSNLKIDFKVLKSDIKETINKGEDPKVVATSISLQKALDVASKVDKDDIVIGADTIVVCQNEILGKPEDEKQAYEMLKKLSGKYHTVMTGISIIRLSDNKKIVDCVSTNVKMKELDDNKINRYIQTKEPLDKAGAYGIQGFGALLVEKIEGDYFNVVGLPIGTLDEILYRHFDINII
ncbi:septum formation protein [Alkalithermobacter thermoalcaliphilus JW-YL-7 = DSM 7308]|uniref:dTTP/UTP pyrophosphatase n=1 Tax=Alkalithermobacter thermoalcaliphilus JW-YL-7 = DSM 7308 TaxID=1121328 RepID=A0A150FRG4_CLOPD|nr:Septum formation protein Maf [[Clostridium] paradoxum JW-YL-7 = DSM 7308]SHK44358.1 septum formation protein [[Clostridium] paradoxum JW-YL-7 = DSM 7308]